MTVGVIETHRQAAMPDVLDVITDVQRVVGRASSRTTQIDSGVLIVQGRLATAAGARHQRKGWVAGNTQVVIARAREVCMGDIVLVYSDGGRVIDFQVGVVEKLMLNRGADQMRVGLGDVRLDPAQLRRRKRR